MKKLMTLFTVIGMIIVAQAQQNIRFGVKGGLNLSNISGKDIEGTTDARTSFHIGVISEIEISDKFTFQPELLYSSQGIKENNDWAELKLDYLNLPLMAKYYVADNLSIEAGPQLGILLSANAKVEGEGEGDIKELITGFDFGLNFGLGYKLDNGLSFGARYNFGLSKVFDSGYFEETIKANNRVFQISIGYLFN